MPKRDSTLLGTSTVRNAGSGQLKIHTLYVEALPSTKNDARCTLSRKSLIALIEFKTTFDSEEHQDIITQFVSKLNDDERYSLLQQDGVTCYSIDFFKDCFDSPLISKHLWLSRSPRLGTHFFLSVKPSRRTSTVHTRTHWSLRY
jgi:hypothetical protein